MKASLLRWIGDADALRHISRLGVAEVPLALGYQVTRREDFYISLVGELFDRMRDNAATSADWALLGNALGQFAARDRADELKSVGISQIEAALFSSSAFYFGGFPASAYVTMSGMAGRPDQEFARACFDLLARPTDVGSQVVRNLRTALVAGDLQGIAAIANAIAQAAKDALAIGPEEWIPLRLLESLIERFRTTNLRAILPEGTSPFWSPLVSSLVGRGSWDFFPSQIDAIQRGLLLRTDTFSLQMPTGAGKTALCETLLFYHLSARPETAAVLLVPYRSLASELRSSLVRNLNNMGISARCAYGGTVPTGDEVRAFDNTRALVATPETLSGILNANPEFAQRISLVICDEGHLLDAPSRGVGLELLLARMKVRQIGVQRYVFVSAIVPNIEEINAWLGGSDDSVVRSEYRPAIAEYSVLRHAANGSSQPWDLEMHPHQAEPVRYKIEGFLKRADFRFLNLETGNYNTYSFNSLSCIAVAAGRKALTMGAAVVFSANKRGNQGAIGLAEQFLRQAGVNLPLPKPLDYAKAAPVASGVEYLTNEYGENWIGTRALKAGAILHHGDIPQETREVLERLLRKGDVTFGFCTSTLAEGVNLPIRTLVLYSVVRVGADGGRENLTIRDIKNLVGRAGRAGSNTRGLVICANAEQWPLVAAVAEQAPGEPVIGALRSLIERIRQNLATGNFVLSNDLLERSIGAHSLIDGIDSTLVELATVEIGEAELVALATNLADQTFASTRTDPASKQLLRDVFSLRAQRIAGLKQNGRLGLVQQTGAKARLIDLVETQLLPMRDSWEGIGDPLDAGFLDQIFEWAWRHRDLQREVADAYRIDAAGDLTAARTSFFSVVRLWLSGRTFAVIADTAGVSVDESLSIYTGAITFSLQTIVEQGIALLQKLLEAQGVALSPAVVRFPEHLRFGSPSTAGCVLAAGGLSHRRAFVALGNLEFLRDFHPDDRSGIFNAAQTAIESAREEWRGYLGALVEDGEDVLEEIELLVHSFGTYGLREATSQSRLSNCLLC